MYIKAFAEIVLGWQNIPFSIPNRDMAIDSIIGVRATIVEQSVDKNKGISDSFKQYIDVPLVDGKSDKLPRLLIKQNSARLSIGDAQIDIVSHLEFAMSGLNRLTYRLPRACILDQKVFTKYVLAPVVLLEGIFQNPMDVLRYKGEDPYEWDIEESMFGQYKSFFVPNVRPVNGGEIPITENNIQSNV